MKRTTPPGRRQPATIRIRLGLALTLALLPVLLFSVVQSTLSFQREARERQANLVAAAERSAATARARIEAADVLLRTLGPGSLGLQCAHRLAEVVGRIPGYANLIRFDATGRVGCAAASAPPDPGRDARPWFQSLKQGAPVAVTSDPGANYAAEPAFLAAVRDQDENGQFDGALAAVMTLSSLRPEISDRSVPPDSDVALLDRQGRILSATDIRHFPSDPGDRFSGAGRTRPQLWLQQDRQGRARTFSSSPLVGDQVFVVLSAPSQTLISWAWLNPVSVVALPLLAFCLALTAVWLVAERGVVRWIAYLQRIAAIYARGRFTVHPLQADKAPAEIRDLAQTLDQMASTIIARDAALQETLAQKDALLREIHHRVKNNLQVVSSLLSLQQRALTDPAAQAAMSDTRQRIGALALIYRSLYKGDDLKHVDLREFMEELIALLVSSEPWQGGPVRTDLVISPLAIDPDRLSPLALFAVEAISNARKHGLGEGGVLTVTFAVRDSRAELTISDTGVEGAQPKVAKGIGNTLMTAFARQLRGEVAFCPSAEGGLTVKLTFPMPDEAVEPGAEAAREGAAA